ncbi:MAG: (2Fe-2S)-binding protein, partial [Marinobacter sp.]|nr:(2Fe-2S)-binding protein [Marinobacter sp.]
GRVRSAPEQRRGEVFVPIHWNDQFTGQGLATALTDSLVDPISGQPEAKHGRATLTHWPARWYGRLLVRRDRPKRWKADYWAQQVLPDCDSWIVAGQCKMDWKSAVPDWLGGQPQLVMEDVREGRFRAARLRNGQLEAVLMVDRDAAALPSVDWLVSCFSQPELDEASRRGLLAAKAVDGDDAGNLVCSCFQVGDRQIQQAIGRGANSVDALGRELKCGTNCGSCVPEIRSLLVASTEVV